MSSLCYKSADFGVQSVASVNKHTHTHTYAEGGGSAHVPPWHIHLLFQPSFSALFIWMAVIWARSGRRQFSLLFRPRHFRIIMRRARDSSCWMQPSSRLTNCRGSLVFFPSWLECVLLPAPPDRPGLHTKHTSPAKCWRKNETFQGSEMNDLGQNTWKGNTLLMCNKQTWKKKLEFWVRILKSKSLGCLNWLQSHNLELNPKVKKTRKCI